MKKVTIITVVFNGAKTIRDAIDSVLAQDYPAVEYIIIDGNSTDGTQEVLNAYAPRISRIISEPDQGIYDAMNKGLGLARGEIVGILNADDVYAYPQVVSDVVHLMTQENSDAVYGDLYYVNGVQTERVVRKWISGKYKPGAFLRGWMPPHPTLFVRRSAYEKFGHFRTDLSSAADYELMLRMIHKEGISLSYLNKILVKMRTGGASNNSLKARLRANINDRKAWEVNGLKPARTTLYLKPLRKLSQFVPRKNR